MKERGWDFGEKPTGGTGACKDSPRSRRRLWKRSEKLLLMKNAD